MPFDSGVKQNVMVTSNGEFGVIAGGENPLDDARTIRALDLVVGQQTWTLLHADPDWRWMLERDDSPWYPTMPLFRQPRPGCWDLVIDEVIQALRRYWA